MLKLLIVDDEPIIRSGIRTIIEWEKYGYVICGEAEDGPSAVKAISELKPDLVLLDLHLPGFSGLEVIRKSKAERKSTHFLILSGYAEFEYAQEAINLEANGYMVKPIDENVLVKRIVFIARKIKDTDEQRQVQFLEIMEGVYKEEAGDFFFSDGYVQAVFVSVESLPSKERARRLQTLKGFFQEGICHVFQYREFIVFLFENTPETVIKRLLENLCDFLLKSKDQSDVTLGSRCREERSSPGLGIRKTCQEAELLMENIFFYRGKKYLSLEDIQAKKNTGADWDAEEEAKKLCAYIQVVDNKKIRSFFRDLEDNFSHSGKSTQEIRQECMALMIEVRNDIVKKFPALKEMLGTGKETLDAIMKKRYLGLIVDAMTDACLRMSESLPLLSADSNFQRIISYVKNNYNENLRLETLGQLFYYNCAYLGKRFKEYTGKNFHTYLDMLRIDAAKELLQNTDMKVYEISNKVGYANTDYFYSKFRKHAGKSPLVFRKKEE
jgi:two-component system response regulator YesN